MCFQITLCCLQEKVIFRYDPGIPFSSSRINCPNNGRENMPARVVDGDAIYLSDKIRSLKPEYRAEYSYLLPLAEANGVFEANPDRIWVTAYAYHRDGTTPGWVRDLLTDFERVDLLRTWKESGKVWGYWTGIDKFGRLPGKEHRKRYKNLPPNPSPRFLEDEFIRDNPGDSGIDQD
jgi:hypothetical protein